MGPPMITALPEGLRGAVEKAAGEAEIREQTAEWVVLAFLNAALDAGVAREAEMSAGRFGWTASTEPGQNLAPVFPALILRLGDGP